MSWVADLKRRVRSHVERKKQKQYAKYVEARGIGEGTKTYAQYHAKEPKKDESVVSKIKQAGADRDSSLEEALSPDELAKLGYKPRKKK